MNHDVPITRAHAFALLYSHQLPMVRFVGSTLEAWGECVGPDGSEFCERTTFEPDRDGDFDLEAIRDWLGY